MKKFLLFTGVCASLLCGSHAHAYTIDRIVEECPYMISELKHQKAIYYAGWYYQVYIDVNVMRGYGIRLEKVDDTHLKFCGFEGKYDFVFTLTDANGNESADGTQLRINGMTANTNQDQTDNTAYYIYPIISTSVYQGAYNWNREENFVLSITNDSAGNIVFGHLPTHTRSGRGYFIYKWQASTPGDCAAIVIDCTFAPPAHYAAINTTYSAGYASDRFDDYKYYSSAAASATAPRGAQRIRTEERTYPVLVNWNTSARTFSIINFGALGFGYDPTQQDIQSGTFAADGTCTLSNDNLFYHLNSGDMDESGFDGYYPTRFVPASNIIGTDKVTGTWEAVEVKHNAVQHHWVTNGGQRRTFEGIEMTLEPYTLLNSTGRVNKATNLKFDGGYFDTKLLFGNDVTSDVELVLDEFGTSDQQVRVAGRIVTHDNDKYVDHYEVCMVPGRYSSINQHDGFKDASAPHGHTDATNIYSTDYDYVTGGASKAARADASTGSHDYSFDKIIDKSEAGAADHYTFYIKTVYRTDEYPQLAPTFHSMQTIDRTTGIDSVGNDTDADAPVEYFNLQGMRVAAPQHGVYIRRRGNTSEKVVL